MADNRNTTAEEHTDKDMQVVTQLAYMKKHSLYSVHAEFMPVLPKRLKSQY